MRIRVRNLVAHTFHARQRVAVHVIFLEGVCNVLVVLVDGRHVHKRVPPVVALAQTSRYIRRLAICHQPHNDGVGPLSVVVVLVVPALAHGNLVGHNANLGVILMDVALRFVAHGIDFGGLKEHVVVGVRVERGIPSIERTVSVGVGQIPRSIFRRSQIGNE